MNSKITPFLFFLLTLSSFFSCKNDDQETPLQEFEFSITQDGFQLYHSWTEVNISDFQQYIIVRSKEPIPVNLDPFLSSASNSEINKIVHQETSSSNSAWRELVLSEQTKLYYRVFIKLSDRYIASNEVEVSFDEKLIFTSTQNSNIEVFHHPDLRLIYFIDIDSLFAYDYQSRELVAATELPSLFYDGLFSYGKINGQDEIYLIPQGANDDEIIILDAMNLNYIETFTTGYGRIKAINTDREGVIVIAKDWSESLKVFDRLSGSEIGNASCACSDVYHKSLGFISETENTIRMIYSDGIRNGGFVDYFFSPTWEFDSESSITYFPSNVLPKIGYSTDRNYFIPNSNGTIYEKNGTIFNSIYDTLSDRGTSYSSVFFENESALMTIDDHSLFPNADDLRSIDKYSFPDIELLDSWRLRHNLSIVEWYELFYDGDNLLLSYGTSTGGINRIMIVPLNM